MTTKRKNVPPPVVAERLEIVQEYRKGDIDRKTCIIRLVETGMSLHVIAEMIRSYDTDKEVQR